MKQLVADKNILSDLKLRGSYGILGDDRNPNDANQSIVTPYAFLGRV
ncbi:MAG: hypothetical protein WKG06_03685 [Segetibacter sp.]